MNASRPLDQDEYRKQYDDLLEQANSAKTELQRINNEIARKRKQRKMLLAFVRELECREGILAEFDEGLWVAMVESVEVSAKELLFTFKEGSTHVAQITR